MLKAIKRLFCRHEFKPIIESKLEFCKIGAYSWEYKESSCISICSKCGKVKYIKMIKWITRILCHHWYLPLQIGIEEYLYYNGAKEENAIFSKTREKCCYCGKIRRIKSKKS